AFACDRQKRVREPRPKIARWIDGVTRCSAQREPNAPNKARYKIRSYARGRTRSRTTLRKNGTDHKNEHKGSNNLAQQICSCVSNRRGSTKYTQLRSRIRRFLPVRQVVQPDERCADYRAQQLRGQIWQKVSVSSGTHRKSQR